MRVALGVPTMVPAVSPKKTIAPAWNPVPVIVTCVSPTTGTESVERWVTFGGGAMPVPLSATVCGLPAALSETVDVPVRGPSTVGAKDAPRSCN